MHSASSTTWQFDSTWHATVLEGEHSGKILLFDRVTERRCRVSDEVYQIARLFADHKTVDAALHEHKKGTPETSAARFTEICQSLVDSGMLARKQENSAVAADMGQTRRRKAVSQQWLNPFGLRVDLGDPTTLLDRISVFTRCVYGLPGAVIAAITLVFLPWLLWQNGSALAAHVSDDIPTLHLLFAMLCVWPLLKCVHELGHAAVLHRFGGNVKRFGVAFLFFMPVPYVDASEAWSLPHRAQRIAVSAAGLLSELVVACIALWCWQMAVDGTAKTLLSATVMVACVSSVLVNANPLMKFDGYHVLQDVLKTTNLQADASLTLKRLFWRSLGAPPDKTQLGPRWGVNATYGVLALCFKLFVVLSVCLWFLSDVPLIGSGLAFWLMLSAITIPVVKVGLDTVRRHRELFVSRRRQVRATATVVAAGLLLVAVPVPRQHTLDGVTAFSNAGTLVTATEGVVELFVADGDRVQKGQRVAQMSSRQLHHEHRMKALARDRLIEKRRSLQFDSDEKARQTLATLKPGIEAARQDLRLHREKMEDLFVHAPSEGQISLDPNSRIAGMWLHQGQVLGSIIPDSRIEINTLVSQQVATLLKSDLRAASAVVAGSPFDVLPVEIASVSPVSADTVTETALTLKGGGAIAVDNDMQTTDQDAAFFSVRLSPSDSSFGDLVQGKRVRVRYSLTPKPVATQIVTALRNTFFNVELNS